MPVPVLKRSSSSFFANLARKKTASGEPTKKKADTDLSSTSDDEPLHDAGPITSLPPAHVEQDVLSLFSHAQNGMFDEILDRAAGMSSVRIAEVLNYRRTLPRIVSLAHIYALSKSSTATDREIARLIQQGVLRRTAVMGRGNGIAPVGEGLALVREWEEVVRQSSMNEALKTKYIEAMRTAPASTSIPAASFSSSEISDMVCAGLLTFASPLAVPSLSSRLGSGCPSVAMAGSTAATGTLQAVGGDQAVHDSGGGGRGLAANQSSRNAQSVGDLTFTLPAIGVYLRLLTEARQHVLALLSRASPTFKETTKDLLRERWNGGIGEKGLVLAKKARGESVGVTPGKTKKWKNFYGMRFDWILEEVVGSGLAECFNTGSVGLGVRVSR